MDRPLPRVVALVVPLVAAGLALPAHPAGAASAAGRRTATTSVFVSLEKCKKIDGAKAGEGGDFATLRCGRPVSGWQVQLDYDDARESITLIRGGSEHPLNLWSVVGGGFSNVGPRFEFRVRDRRPVAGIVRFEHVTNPADSTSVSALIVVKLAPTPCVAGIVAPGPGQNDDARALADRIDSLSCVPEPTS